MRRTTLRLISVAGLCCLIGLAILRHLGNRPSGPALTTSAGQLSEARGDSARHEALSTSPLLSGFTNPALFIASPPLSASAPDARSASQPVWVNPSSNQVLQIIAKDIAEGINAEVRAKEARLRQAVQGLKVGWSAGQVMELLGQPDTAQRKVASDGVIRYERLSAPENLHQPRDGFFGYWPRVGVPFNGANGQGYFILYVQFDSSGRMATSWWHTPFEMASGSLNQVRTQEEYWRGVHDNSGPPPIQVVPEYW